MNRHLTALAASLALLLATGAQAGRLSPDLEEEIAGLRPGEPVDVIIRCENPLDLASVSPRKLLRALRNKAMDCETSLGEELEFSALVSPQTLWIINGIATRVPVAALRRLVHRAGVDTISRNEKVKLRPAPELASLPGNPATPYWNLDETRATDLWSQGIYGTGAVVATLDTGVDIEHADLGPKWRGGENSWYDPHGEHGSPFDANGHGTGVMGLIVGGNETFWDIGMAPDAQWIAAKIFDDAGNTDLGKIHQAFQWLLDPDGNPATDDRPDIVNNSWTLQGTTDLCFGEFAADIAALRAADIAVVFSAGNSGPNSATSVAPANDPGSLSVGATGSLQEIESFSSRGPNPCGGGHYPLVSAPGKDVLTTGLTGNGSNPIAIAFGSGTSYAAAHVAGAMALLKSAVPGASMAQIEAAIEDGSLDLGDPGADNDYGAGLLDVEPPPPSDTDEDGVTDDLDQCPNTPLGEAVDSIGCSASQLDSDGDSVSDALDLCPNTPTGDVVDADGCSASQLDNDGDSFAADVDCNDGDALTYPGAPEVKHDGIDQDCNGYDLTIDVTRAWYLATDDKVIVRATSALGDQAGLRVRFKLANGSSFGRRLRWKAAKNRWQKVIGGFAEGFGATPVSVAVVGVEGKQFSEVQIR